jgi:SAM-dependent methyltransferase
MKAMTLENAYAQVFAGMTRQGPGSVSSTRKALSLLPSLVDGTVLDLGCGTGASTLVLAAELGRPVLASDVNPASLDAVNARAAEAGLTGRVTTVTASMDAVDQPADSAALIWSEGAVFTVGVETALKHWHPILKTGGIAAFSDLCWFGAERPTDALAFYDDVYPAMKGVEALLAATFASGYRLHAVFTQPDSDWWDEYLAQVVKAVERNRADPDPYVQRVIAICDRELDVMSRFGWALGYAFVIAQKV